MIFVFTMVGLLGTATFVVHALPLRSNAHINLLGNVSRPLIGNIRGSGYTEAITTNSNGVRVRVLVRSRNANGAVLGDNDSTWRQNTVASGRTLNLWSRASVGTHTGTSRRGRVRLEEQPPLLLGHLPYLMREHGIKK